MSYDKRLPKAWEAINKNKSDILLKLDKGSFNGTADDLLPKSGGFMTGNIFNDIDDNVEGLMTFKRDAKLFQANSFVAGLKAQWIDESGVLGIVRGEGTGIGTDGAKFKLQDNLYTLMHTGNCPISKQQNGYCKLANGMIMQWGYFVRNDASGTTRINFPVAFTSFSYSVSFVDIISQSASNNTALKYAGWNNVYFDAVHNVGQIGVQWMAIGY